MGHCRFVSRPFTIKEYEHHVIDPRNVRSRIPRLVPTSAVPASTNEDPSSAYQAFVGNSLHSTEPQEQNDGRTQFSSCPLSDRYRDRNPEGVAQDEGPSKLHSQMVNDSWNLETTVEIPNEARKKRLHCQRRCFARQKAVGNQEPLIWKTRVANYSLDNDKGLLQRTNIQISHLLPKALNVANIAMDGIQSSTKDLLFLAGIENR